MSGVKTVEELEKELCNTKSKLSYYKNRNGHKPKGRAKKRASTLLKNQEWNDAKRAMATVIARLTASTEEEFKKVRDEAYAMSITEVKELAKGHEEEVAEELIARRERRNAKTAEKVAMTKMVGVKPVEDKKTLMELIRSTKPNYGSSTIQTEPDYTTGPMEVPVKIKAPILRLAVTAVESMTGFVGLSMDLVVGHILSRYLEDNS